MVLLYIAIAILSLVFIPKIYRYINKKRHPFSGKIETFKDVNDFIINCDFLHFNDIEKGARYDYYIVGKIEKRISEDKFITVFPAIYRAEEYDTHWFFMRNRVNYPTRAFIWNHKDAINAQLDVEKMIKEKDRKEKEKILQLKELDKNIKNIFKFSAGIK